ncbi:MAG TPA: Gfo/Idh/MocA family oxidoreductase [Nocardiopsis listeri]|uniref:Gfo/Idh/MocA family protein n=1 Tax=Nocardiopsis listeri TaxID=53440 RepID=UPI001DC03D11|nr:Gfo/Idh/MocA family oxidoreductase [Nocardiopsis listeri]HJE56953.1 Gfo/Idh/MocA family oxidoreductase [Nocardiopsis listeri]
MDLRPPPSNTRDSNAPTTLKIGVIGLLGSSGRQHAEVLDGSDGATLLAGTDMRASAAPGGTPQDGPELRSLRGLLDDPSVNAVALCVPPGERGSLAHQILDAGRHLVVEKPVARTLEEFDTLVGHAEASSLTVAVMLQHRHALPEAVFENDFGPARAELIISRPRPPEHYRNGWRADPATSWGGVVTHLGIHYLDLACLLLGTPRSVRVEEARYAAPGVETTLSARVEFEDGHRLRALITSDAEHRMERLTLLGRQDWLEVCDGSVRGRIGGSDVRSERRPVHELRSLVYREFAGAVLNGRPLGLSSMRRARDTTALLEMLRDVIETGGTP